MTLLRNRRAAVEVLAEDGSLSRRWENLRISAKVKRRYRSRPDEATIEIYNLSSASYDRIVSRGEKVRLFAGYEGSVFKLFSGDLDDDSVRRERRGPDVVTVIEAEDGILAWRRAQVDISVSASGSLDDVLDAIAASFRAQGLVVDTAVLRTLPRVQQVQGFTYSGLAHPALSAITDELGYEWTIEDNELRIRDPQRALDETEGVVLSMQRGTLFGSPKPTDSGVEATTLLQPGILPRRFAAIQSETSKAWYRIRDVEYVLDTHDKPWYATFDAQDL